MYRLSADEALVTEMPVIDAILGSHAADLGDDLELYRHHAYRVANLCLAQLPQSGEAVEKVAIAAAFHDLGIWTDRTFDYLRPSADLARTYLTQSGRPGWIAEITAAIFAHHKVTPSSGHDGWLVEPFRRADWMDVTMGVRTFGLPHRLLKATVARWPRTGFHRRLVQLALRRMLTHPWSPFPMVRL